MILVFHSQQMLNKLGYGKAFIGAEAGVDIFFVISGFIIFYIANQRKLTATDFIVKRLIRIVPLYWFYTSALVALLMVFPQAFNRLNFDLSNIIKSYLFLLSKNNIGNIGTVLFVGWSLTFEMYFYILFSLSLIISPRTQLPFLVIVILIGSILSFFIKNLPDFSLVIFSPLPLEFLAGCFIAKLYLNQKYLQPTLAIAAILLGIFGIIVSGLFGVILSALDANRVGYFALPALFIVYGLVSLEAKQKIQFPTISLFLGDASYSIYLCHLFVIATVSKSYLYFGIAGWMPPEGLLIFAIAASLIVGSLSYRIFEKPLTDWLNKLWKARAKSLA